MQEQMSELNRNYQDQKVASENTKAELDGCKEQISALEAMRLNLEVNFMILHQSTFDRGQKEYEKVSH